jgi:DNA/RNA endonuclease G (NUC1)
MPNVESVGEEWKPYITNIAAVEAKTGFHLLDNVPNDIAAVLRNKIDSEGSR